MAEVSRRAYLSSSGGSSQKALSHKRGGIGRLQQPGRPQARPQRAPDPCRRRQLPPRTDECSLSDTANLF